MSRLLNLNQCPFYEESGDVKVTTDYGKDIKDYPVTGKTGDHWGIDCVRSTENDNSKSATIVSPLNGTVTAQRRYVKDGQKSPSGGNCVYIISDDHHYLFIFLHLKEGTVPDTIKDGARINKGDVLGVMGNTGYSFGVHLHFQVEYIENPPEVIDHTTRGIPIDPEPYITGEVPFPDTTKYGVILSYDTEQEAREIALALKVLGLNPTLAEVE